MDREDFYDEININEIFGNYTKNNSLEKVQEIIRGRTSYKDSKVIWEKKNRLGESFYVIEFEESKKISIILCPEIEILLHGETGSILIGKIRVECEINISNGKRRLLHKEILVESEHCGTGTLLEHELEEAAKRRHFQVITGRIYYENLQQKDRLIKFYQDNGYEYDKDTDKIIKIVK